MENLKVGIIGLDTSHTIEFTKRFQAPDCPAEERVEGVQVITCMRFPTPFQSEEGQDARQKTMESWGVKVTTSFEEAVSGCDAVMIEINDPSLHLEYFKKCAGLGIPVYLDKPLADSIETGREIYRIAKEKNIRVFSASSLRFAAELLQASNKIPKPESAHMYGPVGKAPAGSSIVWYGVHAFEMLVRTMGSGAKSLHAVTKDNIITVNVKYPEGRMGRVDLNPDDWTYKGTLYGHGNEASFTIDFGPVYSAELREIAAFFKGATAPVSLKDTLEVMALLDAADKSAASGNPVEIDLS